MNYLNEEGSWTLFFNLMNTKDLLNHLNRLQMKPETILGVMVAHAQQLENWKESATFILTEWDSVWEAAGKPGQLGSSKAAAVREMFCTKVPVCENINPCQKQIKSMSQHQQRVKIAQVCGLWKKRDCRRQSAMFKTTLNSWNGCLITRTT